jgi:hypothetical protein
MARLTRNNDGKIGGYLVGRRHKTGGIQAKQVETGKPIELESDEVIITRRAVLSPEKHEFDGQQLTNLEILSQINQEGGGVALMEQGGQVPDPCLCRCGCRMHSYNGYQSISSRNILRELEQQGRQADAEEYLKRLEAINTALPYVSGPERHILTREASALLMHYRQCTINY